MVLPPAVTVKAVTGGRLDPSRFSENWNRIIEPLGTTVALTSVGGVVSGAATAAVATLVRVSALLASSVKLTFTLIVVPRSSVTSV